MDRPSITLNNETAASHPASAGVSKLRWARFYPKWPLILGSLLVVSVWGASYISLWMSPLVLLGIVFNVLYWVRVKEHFEHGDSNPGIVLSVNPTVIAVATDLTKGAGTYPAVKVFRSRLRKVLGEKVQPGMRLPTVSLYSPGNDSNLAYWVDFEPVPVECGTSDAGTIERITASFTAEHWDMLETYVALLPCAAPGLYRFDPQPPKPTHFVFAKIAEDIGPMERRRKYTEPLDEALRAAGLGRTTGAGTMLDENGAVKWIGIDIELTNLSDGIECARRTLADLGAPAGSLLESCVDGANLEWQIVENQS